VSEGANTLARAECLLEARDPVRALVLFDRAEAEGHNPDRCAAGRWTAAMLSGDFSAAWHESDAIRLRGSPDPNRLWEGEDFCNKRIILRCLHGLGDAVQFLRYAPLLRARAERLIVECAPCATELVRCLPGIDEVVTWGPKSPITPSVWDIQIEIMELPYLFRSTLTSLPTTESYLHLPEGDLQHASDLLAYGCGPRIGIVWSAGKWNPSRSIPLYLLAPTLTRHDVKFWNLQGGLVRQQWSNLPCSPNFHDLSILADAGVVPLAAVIAQLDLVITVDTLAAHIAGALNIPCLLLLQYAADWRWMIDRDDSPWYPSLRLLRQPEPNDWPGVVRNLDRVLDQWLANWKQASR